MVFHFNREKAALMVIDMQKGFIDQGAAMEVPPGKLIIPNIQQLIRNYRRHQIPVIYTRFVYSPKVPNLIGELHEQHKPPIGCCMVGDASVEIVEALNPHNEDLVIDKHGYDAFHNTELDYALRSLDVKQLIVTGVMTDICVLSTITSALHLEYQVWAVSDATATVWDHVQSVTMDLCQRAYGMVTTTEGAIELLAV